MDRRGGGIRLDRARNRWIREITATQRGRETSQLARALDTAKRKCGAPRRPGTLAKDVPGLSISSVRVEGRALPEIPEVRGGRRAGPGSHGRGLGLKCGCLPFGGAHRRCRGCPLACYPERTRQIGRAHV